MGADHGFLRGLRCKPANKKGRSNITARKQAEQVLAEREAECRAVIETAADGFCMLDDEGRILAVNAAYVRRSGYSRDELSSMRISDLEVQESREDVRAHIEKLRREGSDLFETRHRAKDGEIWPIEVNAAYWPSAGGHYIAFLHDITQRKRYKQEFRSLADSSPDSIMRYDREGRILYLNQKLSCDLGLTEAELIGKTTYEVWPDNRFAEIERAVVRAIRTGEATTVELSHLLATGESIFSQIRVVAERDTAGRIVGALAFGRDITAITETERRLTHFIENLPGMAYVFRLSPDGCGCFPFVSSGIEEIYGLKPEDVKDDMGTIYNLTHPVDRQRIKVAIAESARTLTPFRMEFRICRPGLPERWGNARAVPERQADGDILWYGIMFDITERKRTQVTLQAMNAEMEQIMRFHVASQTIAAITHELNQPLSAVSSYAEAALRMLRAGNPQPAKLRHALEQSVEQARRAGQVVCELLTFMNQGEVRVEAVDLNDTARRVLERVKGEYPDSFEGRLVLEPGLPRVGANRLQVEKVLTNLIENSLDAMRDDEAGERLITITVCSCSEGQGAQVTVSDSGSGIDAQNIHRIFEPFFTTKPKGLGMGLAISRAIINANGGQLSVESEPTSGASFHFTLPFAS
jgi:PAS domain S-box-containing protein